MSEPNSLKQKRKFHAMVRDIARQIPWAGEMMDEHEWKLLILAAAHGQDAVPNPFNPTSAFVIRNKKRTRDLEMPTMAELITQLLAFGAEKGVEWTDPEWKAMREADAKDAEMWAAHVV
jgi:hypothetical protein